MIPYAKRYYYKILISSFTTQRKKYFKSVSMLWFMYNTHIFFNTEPLAVYMAVCKCRPNYIA